MALLFLRRSHDPDSVVGPLTPDQVWEASPSEDDCLSLRESGPFVPVGVGLNYDDRLREVMLEAFPNPRAYRYARKRLALYLCLVPILLWTLMDGQMLVAGRDGAMAALMMDVLSVVWVAVDLGRPVPRHPHLMAAAFGCASMRWIQFACMRCGDASGLWMLAFALLAAVGALWMLWAAPSPRAMADHIRAALAIPPPTVLPSRSTPGFFRTIVFSVSAAGLLPVILWLMRDQAWSLQMQLIVFAAFSLLVPYAGRVYVGREPPIHRDVWVGAFGGSVACFRSTPRVKVQALAKAAMVGITCLILSFSLVRGCQGGVEAVASAQQCVAAEPSALHRLLDEQRVETSTSVPSKEMKWLLLTGLMVPAAEELVYRGLVQHALRRRLKRRWAIGVSALLFGVAHVVVFPMSVYQTVLLGLSFGIAYERGGILASLWAHMLWNLWLSI